MSGFGLAWRHALLDLRGGMRHLRLLCICLMLGVGVMGWIGLVIASLKGGIDRDAKSLLGGDIEVKQIYEEIPMAIVAWLQFHSEALSRVMTMRSMAEKPDDPNSAPTLVELKSVDGIYPLYGRLTFREKLRKDPLHNPGPRGVFGAAVDQSLLDALNLKLGDVFRIGEAQYRIEAVLESEPDRTVSGLSLGPRVLVTSNGFLATRLVKYGSMVHYHYRLRLPAGTDLDAWKKTLGEEFSGAHWNVRDWRDSSPGLMTLIDRLALFFALTGVTTLVVAGLGISNAAGTYVWSKWQTIATLKCLGADMAHIRKVYLIQLLIAAGLAIAGGLLLSLIGEWITLRFFGELLPVRGEGGVYVLPLLLSAALGFATLLLFAMLPIERSAGIKPASLFRGYAPTDHAPSRPAGASLVLMALLTCIMLALAVAFTGTVRIPLYFALGLAFTTLLLLALSAALKRIALRQAHSGRHKLTLAMAFGGLGRPGGATGSIVVALGIGMCLLIALALVGSNLRAQLEEGLPEHAPAFFLVDIQPSERVRLEERLRTLPGIGDISDLPMVRGHITRLNGTPVEQLDIAESARWALRGDRGLTWSATLPKNASMAEGEWWPADYIGKPLVSFDASLARGMGVKLGDTITFASMDKEIDARIANLRDIEWGTLQMNFAIVLSPGALDGLPATWLATVYVSPEHEKDVQKMMAQEFPSVAVVHVREALGKISAMLARISVAVLVVAGITILCGVLVMASAIHASLHRRVHDTVMLKVLGVTSSRILRIYLTEFALVAGAVSLVALVIGSLAAWGVMQLMIFSHFELRPLLMLATLAGSLLVAIGIGLLATRSILKIRPLALLRNE